VRIACRDLEGLATSRFLVIDEVRFVGRRLRLAVAAQVVVDRDQLKSWSLLYLLLYQHWVTVITMIQVQNESESRDLAG